MPKVPSIPQDAPFSAAQRLWLNGFLAGLFTQTEPDNAASESEPARPAPVPLLILFGSQTGTAEGLARRTATEATRRGFIPKVMEANAAPKVDWSAETRLLVITSTYGDGDMPDNAQALWDWLQTDAATVLSHLQYAVLALGDSHYEHFCAAGKKVDGRLEQLGAQRAHPRTDCDLDYEAPAKAWMEGALSALSTTVAPDAGQRQARAGHSELLLPASNAEGFSRTNPFPAILLANRKLTGEGSGKEVRHFEISLEGSGLVYEAGDALGVQPTNCPSAVSELLQTLQCDGEEAVPGPGGGEVSLRKALSELYDITRPGQELMQRLAERNAALRDRLAPNRKEDLKQWLWGREVIDLLLEPPGFSVEAPEFAALLKPLAPRLYSISSSPKAHAGQVHITVGIVRHASHGRARKGVCSNFLADSSPAQVRVPVFIQKAQNFRLPVGGDTPIVMVGPGTGVAPFRAFLHERQATGAKGRNWLFFGEQRAASDFYYREELEPMLSSGLLTKLSTAFSRDQADKIYVQHRMLEQAAELWAWLRDGAHFYVCGDATRMAKDVDAALHRVIETAGARSKEQAAEFVSQMKTEKRYQRDVY
jgi:sulfite reductase (NADPH) flavoprotein alpha-component